MEYKSILLSLFFLVVINLGFGQSDASQSIKQLVETYYPNGNLYIGSACHERFLGTETEDILNWEFNYVTPANKFKQSYIHPEPDKWQWEHTDKWINNCFENNQIMRLHAPISPQCSKWVKNDDRTAQELDLILDEYMTALCTTYCNEPHVKWLDVVNETLNKDGTWFGPQTGTDRWENPWTTIGFDESNELKPPLYIKKAFKIANEHAPNTLQIINQHGAFEEVVWEKIKKLTVYLRDAGFRVDGLGWQAHINLGWELEDGNLQRLSEFIDWSHENNLEFHITEFNVWLKPGNENKLSEQANTYYEIVKLMAAKSKNGVVGINFWHIRGNEVQNDEWDGCLWDENYNAKPAYFKVKQALVDATFSTSIIHNDSYEANDLRPFPNPTSGKVYIPKTKGAIKNVRIVNQLAYTIKINNDNNSIDLSNYEAGMYLLIIETDQGTESDVIVKLNNAN